MYSYTCRNVSLQQQQRCCLKPGRLPSRTAVPVSKVSQGWALLLVTRVGSSSNFLINAFWKAQYIVVFHPLQKKLTGPRTSHNHVGQLQPHACVVLYLLIPASCSPPLYLLSNQNQFQNSTTSQKNIKKNNNNQQSIKPATTIPFFCRASPSGSRLPRRPHRPRQALWTQLSGA